MWKMASEELESESVSDLKWKKLSQPLLALKIEGDKHQGRQVEAGKGKKMDFPIQIEKEYSLDFSPMRPIADFWISDYRIVNLCCFKQQNLC